MRPEVPVGAGAPHGIDETQEGLSLPSLVVGEGQGRVREVRDAADLVPDGRRTVLGAPGAFARCRPPASAQCRCRHHPHLGFAIDGQCDQRGPHRDAAHEVLRAVDGVDHPRPAGPHLSAVLLAEQCVVGAVVREALP